MQLIHPHPFDKLRTGPIFPRQGGRGSFDRLRMSGGGAVGLGLRVDSRLRGNGGREGEGVTA